MSKNIILGLFVSAFTLSVLNVIYESDSLRVTVENYKEIMSCINNDEEDIKRELKKATDACNAAEKNYIKELAKFKTMKKYDEKV